MVRPFFHGIAASSAGGGPSLPLGLDVSWPAAASTSLKLTWNQPSDTAGGITGYKIIKDGSVLVANTGNASTTYTATGLSTSQSYAFRVAGISNSGEGLPCAAVSKSTIAIASISYTGTSDFFGPSTQSGWNVRVWRGSGSFYIASNADNAPISVILVGGGGNSYGTWGPAPGGGGGGVYIVKNATNIPIGSGHTMTFAQGAGGTGAYYNVAPTASTCTNLHYNGSSWETATAGIGSGNGGTTPSGGGGGAGENRGITTSGSGSGVTGSSGSYSNTGGTGGSTSVCYNGSTWAQNSIGAGGGGGGSCSSIAGWPGTGGNGGNGSCASGGTSANGGSGGSGFLATASEGFYGIDNNVGGASDTSNGLMRILGWGGGGAGAAMCWSYYSTGYTGSRGYAYYGGGNAGQSQGAFGFGAFTNVTIPPTNTAPYGMNGQHCSGGGGGSTPNGTVIGGRGGSGTMLVRWHS